MKKLIIAIAALAGIGLYTACSPKKPALFEQKNGIYFGTTTDSLTYSFAKYPKRMVDTLRIPVKVLGDPPSTGKSFLVESATGDGLTAKEGVHYKLLNPYTIPAGQVATTIPVVIYRTPDMDTTVFPFKLQLQASDDFETHMVTKSAYLVKLGYLQKPSNWGTIGGIDWAGYTTNFGTWTRTKYKLILDALYDPVNDTTVTEFPYQRTGFPPAASLYLQIVRNYIRVNYPGNYSTPTLGIGVTLRDPDVKLSDGSNPVIQVGSSNY